MMKVLICCVLVIAAVTAKSVEYERFFDEEAFSDEITADESTGESVMRSLQTRGKVTPHSSVNVFKGGKGSLLSVKDSALNAHNILRSIHGVPKLVWDNKLAADSQVWADKIAASGKLTHSTGDYGENLGQKQISLAGTVYTSSFMVYKWWNECERFNYDYSKEPTNTNAGHFSQVVWASTKLVGCGESTTKIGNNDATFVACRYKPAGNFKGQYVNNVKPLKGGGPKSALDLHKEGCADYCDACSNYKGSCGQSFVKETCCDTCK